ncbi:sugar phosphate isomerase/epimerase [Christensenella sp. MSJ-20]|uniref:sugar phosphate isomerase/epimerase family protein n=1 Tax=Christensenella sp. MSJ-20 TaxID=2841518 RepID=UPI001C77E8DB|nr:sugar phosphate isomerase/epimerase [Christensenella sp. MSJ-20]
MRFGVSTACLFLREYTEDALAVLSRMGVLRVEIFLEGEYEYAPEYVRGLRSILDNHGMACAGVHALPTQFEPQLFSRHDRLCRSAEEIYCRVLEAARVLGAGCYVMHGIVKARRGSRINYEAAGKRLGDLGRMAADHGVLLALENVHWCMLSDPCALEALDPYVDGVTLGYTLDVKQAVQSGYTPWTYLERMGKKLRHVHICGTRVRKDGSIATCMPEEQPGLMEELLSRLCAQEYDGDVVLEVYNQDYGDYNDLARSCRTLAAMVERNK